MMRKKKKKEKKKHRKEFCWIICLVYNYIFFFKSLYENSVTIYSPSCHSKIACLSFFFGT